MKNKCVFVIGPESSGSMLIARICSHVLNIQRYGEWNGVAWSDKGSHKVCHRSLPYGNPPQYPDIKRWVSENEKDYDLYFILTTRDITISEISRFNRWSKPIEQSQLESAKAKEIIATVINAGHSFFIWSYETFMYLEGSYLDILYQFLGVKSDFIPELIDANPGKIGQPRHH